jgi:hypothetical protein
MADYHLGNDLMDFLPAAPRILGKKGAFPRFIGLVAGLAGGLALGVILQLPAAKPAAAAMPANCAGAVMLGGAQLMCSLPAKEPPQLCTYSWALMTTDSQTKIINGSFLLPSGVANMQIYQAFGFNSELSPPIILCDRKHDGS